MAQITSIVKTNKKIGMTSFKAMGLIWRSIRFLKTNTGLFKISWVTGKGRCHIN